MSHSFCTFAQELTQLARTAGIEFVFQEPGDFWANGREITLYQEGGAIHFAMQGPIQVFPRYFAASATAFHGMYREGGAFENEDQARVFLLAWLIERKDADELPTRDIHSRGI